MIITKEKHREDILRYAGQEKVFAEFAKVLKEILVQAGKLYAPFSIAETRPKNISSFAEKIIRKSKYKDPLKDMTDLCGGRIVTHTAEHAKKICEFIKENFLIDEGNSLDVADRLKTGEFGYRSVHYIVTPIKDEILGVKIPDILKDKKAEIQVRTLLQHSWADVLHDRLYKTAIKIPKEWTRDSARLAALLEDAEENITRITSLTDYYTANYGNMMNTEALNNEVEILKIILESDPSENNKPITALRIAKLLRFSGNWEEIINILSKVVDSKSKVAADIQSELGYALCKLEKEESENLKFQLGIDYLLKAAELKEEEGKYISINLTSEDKIGNRNALRYLAKTYESRNNIKKAKELYSLAYLKESNNPYLFAKLLEFNLEYCDHNIAMQKVIKGNIDICNEHIRLGVESIKAYFAIGRLSILNDDFSSAVNAYLKAVSLYSSNTACISEDNFELELKSLARMKEIKSDSVEIAWLEMILLIIAKVKEENEKSSKATKRKTKQLDKISSPVVIIAGGAAQFPENLANRFSLYLNDSVRRFEGTLISGGTTSGVPGLLGSAVEIARKNGNIGINLLGYLPKKNLDGAKIDKAYKIIYTGSSGFSFHDPINMWNDLILSGIKPEDVRLLGINGGRISALEYRLALALGANVAIVKGSGRAANEIFNDSDWNTHPRLHFIPAEPESIWGYINIKINSALPKELLEETAKVIHQKYLDGQFKTIKQDKLNLKPWDELREDYKESNLSSAKFITEILNLAGFVLRKIEGKEKGIKKFSNLELIKMSKLEHGRWVAERLMSGWKYGAEKDDKNKISPYLVTWDEVPADIQKYDTDTVVNYLSLLKLSGYEIFRLHDE